MRLYFTIGNGQPRDPALCRLYRHTFVSMRRECRVIHCAVDPRRLYILCWSEFSRRRLLPAVSPAAGHLTTPTVAGLPGLCENFHPTTSNSSPILRLLSSHWATSVVRTRVVGVANVGDSLRRLSSLQHRIYNLLGWTFRRFDDKTFSTTRVPFKGLLGRWRSF